MLLGTGLLQLKHAFKVLSTDTQPCFGSIIKAHTHIYIGVVPSRRSVASLFTVLFSFSLPQMSLMERGSVRPITAVAWTSNTSTCPKDFTLVGTEIQIYIVVKSVLFI